MPAAPREPFNVLWLQSGGCGGCSMSLLCADTTDFFELLRGAGVNLLWHPSLSVESGHELRHILEECMAGRIRLDALCLEGAVLRGPNGTGRFHMLAGTGRSTYDWVRDLANVARHTIAVGTCAAYGGIPAMNGAGTDACGLQFDGAKPGGALGAAYRSPGGGAGAGTSGRGESWPVINVAGCPTHPDWVIETLTSLATARLAPTDLDALGRPRFYADQLVHHGCTRNEFYEFKASAEKPSDLGCLMEHLGCKGTQAHADCNTRLWNGLGSCTRGGYACISCTEPGFEEPGHPFHATPKIAGIPIGLPTDMPKAWFVALASLSKSATPARVKKNATVDHRVVAPAIRKTTLK